MGEAEHISDQGPLYIRATTALSCYSDDDSSDEEESTFEEDIIVTTTILDHHDKASDNASGDLGDAEDDEVREVARPTKFLSFQSFR